jgi:hypothetical protein
MRRLSYRSPAAALFYQLIDGQSLVADGGGGDRRPSHWPQDHGRRPIEPQPELVLAGVVVNGGRETSAIGQLHRDGRV